MAEALTVQQQDAVAVTNAALVEVCEAKGISPAIVLFVLEAVRKGADQQFPQYAAIIDMVMSLVEKMVPAA